MELTTLTNISLEDDPDCIKDSSVLQTGAFKLENLTKFIHMLQY